MRVMRIIERWNIRDASKRYVLITVTVIVYIVLHYLSSFTMKLLHEEIY